MKLVDHSSLPFGGASAGGGEAISLKLQLAGFLAILKRKRALLAICAAATLAAAMLYVMIATPSYIATAKIIIDPRPTSDSFRADTITVSAPTAESAMLDSQVEILKSERIARVVINNLKLREDEEFSGGAAGPISSFISSIRQMLSDDDSEDRWMKGMLDTFDQRLSVKHVGISYIIEVSFRSKSRLKAARIANEIVDVYINEQLQSKYDVTKRASLWLQDRLKELRDQATNAARQVQEFKSESRIIDSGGGKLIFDQQLADLSTQLSAARGATAQARAKRDRVEIVLKSGAAAEGMVPDGMSNDVMTKLRAQYLEAQKVEADWSQRYGGKHRAVIDLRNQMKEIKRAITDELRRISQSLNSEFEIALAREQALDKALNEMIGQSSQTRQAQVKSRELESEATSLQLLYDNFLQRYMQAVQQQTFPIAQARIVSEATAPNKKSWPRASLLLPAALILGLLLGLAIVFAQEALDHTVRSPAQLRSQIGVDCFGMLPFLELPRERRSRIRRLKDFIRNRGPADPIPMPTKELIEITLNEPFSRFTETLRGAKFSLDSRKRTEQTKVIAFMSAWSGEGTTIAAINFARLVASMGQTTVLVECDLSNVKMTRLMAGEAQFGILDILTRRKRVEDVVVRDARSGLDILPCRSSRRLVHTSSILSSAPMDQLLQELRRKYDYVILDCPPQAEYADVAAIAHLVDGYMLIAAWGSTNLPALTEEIEANGVVRKKIIGSILNKVEPASLPGGEAKFARNQPTPIAPSETAKAA